MRASVLQMTPGVGKAATVAQADRLMDDAATDRPGVVSLLEIWICLGGGAKLVRSEAVPPPGSNKPECWMAAPATWGRNLDAKGEPRTTFGHLLGCDTWSHGVANASNGLGWATGQIDPAATARLRRDMPVLDHRRLA